MRGTPGFSTVCYFGKEDKHNVLVTKYLGSNLKELLTHIRGKFSLETVYKLAIQILDILESLHK